MHMDAVPGWHGGTASLSRRQTVIDPSSVPGTGDLVFRQADVHVTTLLYQINQNVVPNWFGVAVPDRIVDFTKPNLFFHPTPGQDGYDDNYYFSKTGPPGGQQWFHLFYYMELLGYQVDGAIQQFGAPGNQIVVMPFMTSNRTDGGILPADWQGVLTDILTDVRMVMGGGGSGPVSISEIVVSSFSAGYLYSENFRASAVGLAPPMLRQIWDFDGYPEERLEQAPVHDEGHGGQVRSGSRARMFPCAAIALDYKLPEPATQPGGSAEARQPRRHPWRHPQLHVSGRRDPTMMRSGEM